MTYYFLPVIDPVPVGRHRRGASNDVGEAVGRIHKPPPMLQYLSNKKQIKNKLKKYSRPSQGDFKEILREMDGEGNQPAEHYCCQYNVNIPWPAAAWLDREWCKLTGTVTSL